MKRFVLGLAAVAWASAGFVACGDDDDKTDVTPYLGQWYIGQGNVNVACMALGTINTAISGGVTIQKGTSADLVATLSDPAFGGCALQLNVKDNVATPLANQSCTFTFQGIMGTFTVTTGTLSFASNMQANMNLSGTATAQFLGAPIMCQGTVTAGLSRMESTSDAGAQDGAATTDAPTLTDASNTDTATGDAATVGDAATGG